MATRRRPVPKTPGKTPPIFRRQGTITTPVRQKRISTPVRKKK